jgi:hypothetical protein
LYLSPSFARRRNSPSVRNSPLSLANAHTSATRRPPNVVASTAGVHTSADATGKFLSVFYVYENCASSSFPGL